MNLTQTTIHTPLGTMLALADDTHVYLLEFTERIHLERMLGKFLHTLSAKINEGKTAPLISIESELDLYFKGALKEFKTPFKLHGTHFQQMVWQHLYAIPSGTTYSYKELAIAVGNPNAMRAVAGANSTNRLALIIPCHRVINTAGILGGYAAGLDRKRWLLHHEKNR